MKNITKFILSLIIVLGISKSNINADNTYSLGHADFTSDATFYSATSLFTPNQDTFMSPSYITYSYTGIKNERYAYCIDGITNGCTQIDSDFDSGRVGDISINKQQKIVIDYSLLKLGFNRLSFTAFSGKYNDVDHKTIYIYYDNKTLNLIKDQNINPNTLSASSNDANATYAYTITDENKTIIKEGIGDSVPSEVLNSLATNHYNYNVIATLESSLTRKPDYTKNASIPFEIQSNITIPSFDISIKMDKAINPTILSKADSDSNQATYNWQITDKNNNIVNSSNTSFVPSQTINALSDGLYSFHITGSLKYNENLEPIIKTQSINFEIKKEAVVINNSKKEIKTSNLLVKYIYTNNAWFNYETIVYSGTKTTIYYNTYYKNKCSSTIKINNCALNKQLIVKDKKIILYNKTIKYYKQGYPYQIIIYTKDKYNRNTSKTKTTYRVNKTKSRLIAFYYKNNKISLRREYVYNEKGLKQSNSKYKAYRYTTTYKNNKAQKTYRAYYNSRKKLLKSVKVKLRKHF